MGYRTRYECTFCDFTATALERMTVHTAQSRHGGHREIRFVRKSKNRSTSERRRRARAREQQTLTPDQVREQREVEAERQRQAALDKKLKQSLGKRDR